MFFFLFLFHLKTCHNKKNFTQFFFITFFFIANFSLVITVTTVSTVTIGTTVTTIIVTYQMILLFSSIGTNQCLLDHWLKHEWGL